jgi:hypothetical protein
VKKNYLFQPLGSARKRNLVRFLKSRKIAETGVVGVVEGGDGEIIWVPRFAIGQNCRITGDTEQVLRISFQTNR